MENSRRNKKRSKFFWPEIGLLILGVLGFKPELLYDILGITSHANTAASRPLNPNQSNGYQPTATNPLWTWGANALQAAASHAAGTYPAATPTYGVPAYVNASHQNYASQQNPQFQQPGPYADPSLAAYQQPYNATYPQSSWATATNGYAYAPNAANGYSGSGMTRVPPVDYQSTPASYPTQSRSSVPFSSTSSTTPNYNPTFGYTHGANVRKEGTLYDDPRTNFAQNSNYQYPTAQFPSNQFVPTQGSYSPTLSANASPWNGYTNTTNPNSGNTQNQYFWGAVDPRVNNSTRIGSQGGWVPNVPAYNPGPVGMGRF